MNDKLKSLNKRIKADQSTVVKEFQLFKITHEQYKDETQQVKHLIVMKHFIY